MSGILPSFGMFRQKSVGKRETPRHRQTALTSNHGDVVDLSSSGARLRTRHALDGRVEVVLVDYTRQGQLVADVIWTKPVGNFHYEVGVRFRKLTREMSSRLGSIAMSHRFRRAI